jgi:DHA2 family multidrug resistance protein-like MFS transporter
VPRVGTARTVAAALGGATLVFGALSFAGPETSYWLIGIPLFLIGLGLGAAFVPATDAVMAAMPEANAGLGSAINDTGRQVGAALGVGILGALANAGYRGGIGDTVAPLGAEMAAEAERSVGSALEVAGRIGGVEGAAFRDAAIAASVDGFGLAMAAGAVLLAVGAVVVLRRLPSADVPRAEADAHARGDASDEVAAPIGAAGGGES